MTTKKILFNGSDIDRAIVMTQYDLRGFAHSLGFRMEYMKSPKSFILHCLIIFQKLLLRLDGF